MVDRANESPAFDVGVTGNQSSDYDFNQLSQHDLKSGELKFGVPAALVILILVFGAIVAGLVPLLMAIISIVVALGFVAVLSQPFNLSVFIINMLTGMGLALGIDYSLFVVSRYREERGGGQQQFDAIAGAGATASSAVLVSGTAFVVAMCGMMIVPNNVMRSLALGAILVGVVSVIAALTLLPALLGLMGDRVNAAHALLRTSLARAGKSEGRFWSAIVTRVLSAPVVSLVVAVALLLAAAPLSGLKVGSNGVTTLPDRFPSKRGFLALQQYFRARRRIRFASSRITRRIRRSQRRSQRRGRSWPRTASTWVEGTYSHRPTARRNCFRLRFAATQRVQLPSPQYATYARISPRRSQEPTRQCSSAATAQRPPTISTRCRSRRPTCSCSCLG